MCTRRLLKSKSSNFGTLSGCTQRLITYNRDNKGTCSFIRSFASNELAKRKFTIDRWLPPQRFSTKINNSKVDNGCGLWWNYGSSVKFFSSEGDRGNTNNGHVPPVKDSSSIDHKKVWNGKDKDEVRHSEEHARIGALDQKEWLENLSFGNPNKELPFLTRRERFKKEFLKRVIPWEKIRISWDTFPYFVSENTKNLLVECAAAHLKQKKFAHSYGARLASSSGRILLQGISGTELYRERMVKALARDMRVPLLVLDSSILSPFGCDELLDSESDVDEDNVETGEECASCSEAEEDSSNEVENDQVSSDGSDVDKVDVHAPAEALKKLVPHVLEEIGIKISGESESESASSVDHSTSVDSEKHSDRVLKKGDRVKYVGASVCTEVGRRPLSSGQRGEVYEVNDDKVAVILDNNAANEEKNEKITEKDAEPSIYWIDVQDIVHDLDTEAQDWYIAIESLCEILPSLEPIVVYFSDMPHLSSISKKSKHKEFIQKLEEMFNQLEGPIILICGRNKEEIGLKAKDKFMVLPRISQLGRMPVPLHQLAESLRTNKSSKRDGLNKVFNNLLFVDPPKEEEALQMFHKQLDEDRRIVMSRNNLIELHRVLLEHELSCLELSNVTTDGVIFTKEKAEQVVGWARNKYLSTCELPFIKDDRLTLPKESLQAAISRLKEQETTTIKTSLNLKSIAKDDYEKNFVSAVVPANEIGVKFDDIGALEDVKMALDELVSLPMRRPELFSHGNLLRPCKGILLFGPPGTGKTLLAKALATEAGANFISITGSTLTSKWFGDAEKLTKALFSFASRLAPVIIFVDEVDSLLGARGGAVEHEATRRMRNEFMAAWDGLRTKDNQRIIVLGATNRPFDLDDAVIRRLPRRIYVDLPDAINRMKILRIFLAQENLDQGFKYDELANITEGYSGSDLKNLCIAAAYRPVQELLDEEKKEGRIKAAASLRPLNLSDFVQAKSKVGASVAYDAATMNELRKWNEQYGEGGSRRRSPFGFGD